MNRTLALVVGLVSLCLAGPAVSGDNKNNSGKGLNKQAIQELEDAGVTKYTDKFWPDLAQDVGEGWTKYTYLPNAAEGPICITGSPYSVFTKINNPKKLLIFMQGGGACWQGFYNCNPAVEIPGQEPPPPQVGIWADSFPTDKKPIKNPIDDYSVLYMPYCDGSVFSGDNALPDAAFQAHIENLFGLPPGSGPPIRFHRGLQNATAGIDVAKNMFPKARRILLAGSSAGGVGASSFAPFLVRIAYRNKRNLMVFNDAGPVAINLLDVGNILARSADWRFGQFYPASCTECDDVSGQGTAIIKWRLDNDSTIRESFYSTDGDTTNRFFLQVPTQILYRGLILSEHGKLNAAHPDRYKRFIRSGDNSHTALQTDLYYVGTANDVPLYQWVKGFTRGKYSRARHKWVDIVEDFEPAPIP